MSFATSYIALWALTFFLSLVALGLLREVTVLKRSLVSAGFSREAPLVIGSRAPRFTGIDSRTGEKITHSVLHQRPSILMFLSPHCSICRVLAASIESVSKKTSFFLMLICTGDTDPCKEVGQSVDIKTPFLLDPQGDLAELFGISRYPIAVVLDSDRRVLGYGYPGSSKELEEFIDGAFLELKSKSFQAA